MEIIIAFFLYLNDKRKKRFLFKKSKIPLMIITNNDIVMCPIWYNYQVNTVFLPCAHVACYLCSKIIKNCHLCRRKILKTQFFKLP
ncbi:095L [Invertebrate iridescent virus 6]|uniref:Putative RING finger protein 095L n=1 Tax=Invertebrate iridescent virus 6 TaxID=176652 RepID=095L_IIV6|nr:095L [Invertebrate iridescent virus 6]O55718.1 RecName: Full=Putative RING finger protein 095L [Invertebrate iridescent virus 6]AAB94429.1 095L [Invertebrate iridescent virus 6]